MKAKSTTLEEWGAGELGPAQPDCTDDESFADWLRMRTGKRPDFIPRIGFCEDCTPAFKAAMVAKGLCSNPQVRFAHDKEGAIRGYRPKPARKSRAKQAGTSE